MEANLTPAHKAVRVVVLGLRGAGKTCLFKRFVEDAFPSSEDYIPVLFDEIDFSRKSEATGEDFNVLAWEGHRVEHPDYGDRLFPLHYNKTNCLIFLIPIDYRDFVDSIKLTWAPERAHYGRDIPLIFVVSKMDLIRDPASAGLVQASQLILPKDIDYMAKEMGAVSRREISSKNGEGVQELFEEAAQLGFAHAKAERERKEKDNCSQM